MLTGQMSFKEIRVMTNLGDTSIQAQSYADLKLRSTPRLDQVGRRDDKIRLDFNRVEVIKTITQETKRDLAYKVAEKYW